MSEGFPRRGRVEYDDFKVRMQTTAQSLFSYLLSTSFISNLKLNFIVCSLYIFFIELKSFQVRNCAKKFVMHPFLLTG